MAAASNTSLLYRLAHRLRYRALPALVGRRVRVASLADIEPALRELAAPWLAEHATWSAEGRLPGTLEKYGLVDARFDAAPAALDHPETRAGIGLLRDIGFLPPRGERWDATPEELDIPLIAELAGSLGDTAYLKLMMNDDISWEARMAIRRQIGVELPADYFPRELAVTDACITNATFAWFAKHFYL